MCSISCIVGTLKKAIITCVCTCVRIQVMVESDVDRCWQTWQATYLNIISKYIPKKVLPLRRNLPWINLSILQAIKRRNICLRLTNAQAVPLSFYNTSLPKIELIPQLERQNFYSCKHILDVFQAANKKGILYSSPRNSQQWHSHRQCAKS